MDPLSIAASVVGISQAAIIATRELIAYAKDAKNSSRDKKLLAEEALLLSNLLERLRQQTLEKEDKTWLSQHSDMVQQFEAAFIDFARVLKVDMRTGKIPDESRFKSLISSAGWHFSKSEVYGLLQRVERLRHHASALMSDAQLSMLSHIDRQQKEAVDRKTMDDILHWLSPLDMARIHQSISDRVQPGSGEWFLSTPQYLGWLTEAGDVDSLWCWGIPGAGKTVLASIVINHLRQSRGENLRTDIGVAVVYLKYNEPDQTVDTLLGSILKQLVQDSNVLDQTIRDLYEHQGQRNAAPSLHSITLLLQKKAETYKQTFLVIDGLDECEEETRWDLLEQVNNIPGISLMVTSRHLSSIEEEVENFVRIEIKASKVDIELFIEYQVQRNRNLRRMILRNPQLKEDIKLAVVKTAQSMFLLARLHVESLASAASLTIKHVRQKLRELPTTLDTSYDNAMQRINNQEEDHRKLAFKTLAWVTHSFRSLSLRELQHALAVEPGDSNLDEELLMDAQGITALCAGLIVIDKATGNVILVHYSAKSYFENTRQKYFPLYHASMTLSLATYLTLDALQIITIGEMAQRYPLATYAAQYLGDHARHAPEESLETTVLETICRLLTDADKRKPLLTLLDGLDLIRSGYYSTLSADMVEDTTVVGSEAICSELESVSINAGSSVSGTTDYTVVDPAMETWEAKMKSSRIPEVTALHLAASMGLAKVASMLLKEAPNIDAVDETGKTALAVAMERGFEKAVEFLIDGGAFINLVDDHGRRTLLYMAEKDWNDAGNSLVSKVQAQLDDGDSADDPELRFMIAVYLGNADEAVKLSETGHVDLNGSGAAIGSLSLFLAVEHRDGAMVDTLLHAGIDVNAKDSKGQTALFRATRRQDAVMMKIFISADGIEIDSRDDEGLTAWSANVKSRNKEILDILLRAGADPSTRGLQGVSPLYEAATNGETELVRFLLESGTNPSIQTEYEWAPLHWAAANGHEECVQLLLDAGADLHVRSDQGVTPLDLATQARQTVVVEKLKNAGATTAAATQKGGPDLDRTARVRIEPPLSTPLGSIAAPSSSPLDYKLFLVYDNPLSRTLIRRTNVGQFLYPRVQQGSPEPAGYIYQVSHVMETSSSTISVRRSVRRAEMNEYPLQLDDFNFKDALYHITCLRADYQDFELCPGVQAAASYDTDNTISNKSNTSNEFLSASSYRMHKDWTGNWKVRLNFPATPISSNELLFRTTADWAAAAQSDVDSQPDCHWMTEAGRLLARSGWDDGTLNMCIEPALKRGVLDLLVTNSWYNNTVYHITGNFSTPTSRCNSVNWTLSIGVASWRSGIFLKSAVKAAIAEARGDEKYQHHHVHRGSIAGDKQQKGDLHGVSRFEVALLHLVNDEGGDEVILGRRHTISDKVGHVVEETRHLKLPGGDGRGQTHWLAAEASRALELPLDGTAACSKSKDFVMASLFRDNKTLEYDILAIQKPW
ncbi:hypothetical protein B0T26DRAFT_799627 [Lasiosphaeria miniovina]|uniref:NACHT domain-containing protein n=1 Tax=Lasiosphaeria miniovina TaxID=1954250 RepID=A0AA40E7A5_9PEZI|nr:uncharacterized protein B0T26DRAFT_799627 [Lasiosphaeria miniovina]KAK0727687.1 hypothetical protein B0T26DRAFT_799627 [Lasiosphaeria miniovina]